MISTISGIVIGQVIKGLRDSGASLNPQQEHQAAVAVTEKIEPLIRHQTNSEAWYQSRVTIGAIISIASGVAALFGYVIAPQDLELITTSIIAIGPAVGGIITIYGRWRAKKPLGA